MGKRIILAASLFTGSGGTNTGGTNTGGSGTNTGGTNTGGGGANTGGSGGTNTGGTGGTNTGGGSGTNEEEVYNPDPSITTWGTCAADASTIFAVGSGQNIVWVYPADEEAILGKTVKKIKLRTGGSGVFHTVTVRGIVDDAISEDWEYFNPDNVTDVETLTVQGDAIVQTFVLEHPITITRNSRFGLRFSYNDGGRFYYKAEPASKVYCVKVNESCIRHQQVNLNLQLFFE